jgi:hypothetical protein
VTHSPFSRTRRAGKLWQVEESLCQGIARDVDELRAMIQFGTGDAGDGDGQAARRPAPGSLGVALLEPG